ncbi:hypothetical protein [Bradyrhizobium sp. JYMT SZCCT0428]|nr:hypothetical protein [Bradyrhizobium sp. JYMT SZCCT0428]
MRQGLIARIRRATRGRTDVPKIVNNAFELMKRGESIRGVVTF